MRAERGGLTLKTGKIGRVNCLRQQILMPGETMNIALNGQVKLEALRERDVMRINAHLGVFMTPLRWLVSDWPDYVKQGPDSAITIGTSGTIGNWSKYGIGSYSVAAANDFWDYYKDAYLRVYNEWYKWPEDADVTADINDDGEKAVPLSKPWSRCRYDATPDAAADYTQAAATDFDVRDLAETQAKFRGAMKRDVMSYNRWIELNQEVYNQGGSREVDQIPIMIDQTEIGVNPREMPATDGASLGTWQSLYDFGVNHQIRGVTAPEHCILTYMLTVRFAAICEEANPLAIGRLNWHEHTADPEWLSAAQPQEVQMRDLFITDAATSFGYLPAGWQWRSGSDIIGKRIDERDTFPMMNRPSTQAGAKDASNVKGAFRSTALGDYVADIYITESSNQPIGSSLDSFFSGMLDDTKPFPSGGTAEFPQGGKML